MRGWASAAGPDPAIESRPGELRSMQDRAELYGHSFSRVRVGAPSDGEGVIMRKPADLETHRSAIHAYTPWTGQNNWSTLEAAIKSYIALDDGEYSERRSGIDRIEQAFIPCIQDTSGFDTEKKREAQTRMSRLNEQLNREKEEFSTKGSLDLGGKTILTPGEPGATVVSKAATVEPGKGLFREETLENKIKDTKQVHDKRSVGGSLKNSGIVDVFVIQETMTACQIVYWEKKVYSMPGLELVETRQDRTQGWVARGDLEFSSTGTQTVLDLENPTVKDMSDEPLFPHRPSKKDIVQVGLANCYLLAPLISFVDKNPGIIEGMMKDNGDGTVTVRFYDVGVNEQTRTYTARYIKVDKSIIEVGDTAAYSHGALWVQLMEKAFAAGGFTGKLNTGTGLPIKTVRPSYGEIEFGRAFIAMEHLLGEASEKRTLETGGGDVPGTAAAVARLPWSTPEVQAYNLHKRSSNKSQDYRALAAYSVFSGNVERIDTWFTFLERNDLEKLVRARAQKGTRVESYQAELRLEDFEAVFRSKELNAGVRVAMMNWMQTHKIFPGKRGTGKYSNRQIETFNGIVQDLQANKAVVLNSRTSVARATTGFGRSGGEEMAKGLAGKHSYAVLDYGYGSGKTHNARKGPQRWLKVRNPWSQYGRKYDKKGVFDPVLKAQEITRGSGEFWLELSDVTKRFKSSATSAALL